MNKLRSALTMLGIVIGVASVIATVAIGSGATQRIQQQIASIGSNIIIVIPGSMSSSGVRLGSGNAVTLSEADAKELVAQCPDVALATPMVRGGAQVVNGNNNWATSIMGITPDYLTIRELTVAEGSEFAQQDVDSANKVAVLGQTPVDNLFDGADPIGQTIRIKNVPFTVVGVLTRKGQSSSGQDQDDVILLPISTAKRKVIGVKQANADAVDTIMMQAKSGAQIPAAQEEAAALLRQRHHLQANDDNDFSIRNLEELFAAQEASSQIMAVMLAAVASVSLVVGGIGIMNIMLISVQERTREIGLRQALGAKTRTSLHSFWWRPSHFLSQADLLEYSLVLAHLFSFQSWQAGQQLLDQERSCLQFSSLLWWASDLTTIPQERLPFSIQSKHFGTTKSFFNHGHQSESNSGVGLRRAIATIF
ncbi:MAG: ABC transporter permease [Terracidiphilus sp.]